MLSQEMHNDLQELPEADLIALANAFGADKRKKSTALQFLAAVENDQAMASAIKTLATMKAAQAAAKEQGAAVKELVCVVDKDLTFIYNRAYTLKAGERTILPAGVAVHAQWICRKSGVRFESAPVAVE